MIIHTLLLQPKPETTDEDMQRVFEQVKALREKIPGIIDIQAGKNENSAIWAIPTVLLCAS